MARWTVDSIYKMSQHYSTLRFVKFYENILRPQYAPRHKFAFLNNRTVEAFRYGTVYSIDDRFFVEFGPRRNVEELPTEFNFEQYIQIDAEASTASLDYVQNNFVECARRLLPIEPTDTRLDRGDLTWLLKIHVHNVGQGDTIVLEFPDSSLWLVDAYFERNTHHRNYREMFDNWMESHFPEIHHFEYVVASHLHYDHIQGIPYVLGHHKYTFGKVLIPASLRHNSKAVHQLIRYAGGDLIGVKDTIVITRGPLNIQIIPTRLTVGAGVAGENPNDHELALLVNTESSLALLAGDIPALDCDRIIQTSGIPVADKDVRYYKVSHHGSKTGYTPDFYCQYPATHSTISCGRENCYGHPDDPPKSILRDTARLNITHELTASPDTFVVY